MKNKVQLTDYIDHISFTQLSIFEKCKKFYKYKYIDKKIDEVETEQIKTGKFLHGLIKKINKYVEQLKNKTVEMDYEDIIKLFEKGYETEKINDYDFYKRAKESILTYAEETFKNKNELFKCEYEIQMTIGETKLLGIIDRLDNTLDGGMEIWEYKTILAKSKDELKNDLQLNIYAYLVNKLFNPSKIYISNYSILNNIKTKVEINPADLDDVEEYMKKLYNKMKAEKKFEPNLCELCAQCIKCDLYKKVLVDTLNIDIKQTEDLNELVKIYNNVNQNIKALEKVKEVIKQKFEAEVSQTGQIVLDEVEILIVKRHRNEVVIPALDYEQMIIRRKFKK